MDDFLKLVEQDIFYLDGQIKTDDGWWYKGYYHSNEMEGLEGPYHTLEDARVALKLYGEQVG